MNRTYAFTMLVLALLLAVSGCSQDASTAQDGSLRIATTFFPLYELTKAIAPNADVSVIIPPGSEPHDYEPTPGDIEKTARADAVVALDFGGIHFEEVLVDNLDSKKIIPAAAFFNWFANDDEENSGRDIHIWVSPRGAAFLASTIAHDLSIRDPSHAQTYDKNGEMLVQQLDTLSQKYKQGLSNCKKDTILATHDAFGYLGRDFGFDVVSISGFEPEAEPTPAQLKELIDTAKEHDIRYILTEELVDPRVSETIAREVGAQTLQLSPLEGSTDLAKTYLGLMEENLNTLRTALECT